MGALDLWVFDKVACLQSKFSLFSRDTLVVWTERDLTPIELRLLAEQCHKGNARFTLILDDRDGIEQEVSRVANTCVVSLAEQSSPAAEGIQRGSGSGNAIAKLLSDTLGIPPPPSQFYFDFRVPRDGIPAVNFSRILSGDIPGGLIEQKVVLVGRDLPSDRSIVTPIHRGADALSPVFFHALVADAILRSGMVYPVPSMVSWGLGILASLAFALWLRRGTNRGSLCLYLSLVTIILGAIEAILIFSNQWLSPVEIWVLLGATLLATTRFRENVERDSLRSMLRTLAVETRGRARKTSISRDYSPWMMVEKAFASGFSNGQGFALAHTSGGALIPVSDSGRELCQKCFSPDELRPAKEPFASALRNGGSVMGDTLAIIPIRTPARLVGFWVFESDDKRTISEAARYAERMAYYIESLKKRVSRAATTDSNRPLHHQLSSAIDLLEDGRKVLANALDCSREAVLVFDSLGVSEHVSHSSLTLFAGAGINIEGLSPLELIDSLTEVSEAEIRWSLRFVALHRKEVTLLTRPDLIPGRTFFLHLRPLEVGDAVIDETGLPGLVILIEDVTEIANSVLVKDDFMERFHFQLNNDFEAILSAAALIIDPRISTDEQTELLGVITEKVHEATGLFAETREHLQRKFSPDIVERFPIRFERIFDAARASIEREARDRQIGLTLAMSDYLPLVIASPKALEDLIYSILLTLIHNASDNTDLSVAVTLSEGWMSIVLKNRGFGMPEKQLRNLLETGVGGWDTLDRIGSARLTVAAWGGDLQVSSQVGKGIEFKLMLATVL